MGHSKAAYNRPQQGSAANPRHMRTCCLTHLLQRAGTADEPAVIHEVDWTVNNANYISMIGTLGMVWPIWLTLAAFMAATCLVVQLPVPLAVTGMVKLPVLYCLKVLAGSSACQALL